MNTRPRRTQSAAALTAVVVVAAGLVAAYVLLGGGSYKPLAVANPCQPRTLPRSGGGLDRISQQVLLSALDGAACRLRVTREDLALALTTGGTRHEFARTHHIGDKALENAIRAGVERAVNDANRNGQLSGVQATLVRTALAAVPVDKLIELVRTPRGLEELLGGFLTP